MAEAIVSAAAKQVVNLIAWEANFLWGIDGQIKQLQEELNLMQSFLTDADSRQAESDPLQKCVAEIRNIAYDVEDVVEKFNLKVVSKRKEGCWNSIKRCACFLREGLALHKIKLQIDELTNRIKKATGHLKAYGVLQAVKDGEGPSSSNRLRRRELRRSYPHIQEEKVVGFDRQIEELISVLMKDHRTVSICGMGGVGKTTLAKKVFNHHQTNKCHFEHFAWVYISQQFDRDDVWEVIMSQLGILIDAKEITFRRKSPGEKAKKLCNFLKENRCLVVLDDIWSTEAWDLLKYGFPSEEAKSKILLTTRYKRVALRTEGYLHEVECLDGQKSWELLKRVAFPRQDSPDRARMEELGKEMVTHCSGLPLAIVVLGGILAQYDTYPQWQEVHNNVKSHIRKSKDYNVQDILALSYNDLSPHQKLCFLYLGHFREDQEIPARKLIHMWVAEGFVPQEEEGNENMEDVAEQYLVELVQRYMIQVARLDANINQINTCRMHDLMRDFCITKAKQENFLHIFDNFSNPSTPAVTSAHRLATHKPIQISRIKNPQIRSLFYLFDEKFPEDLFGEKSLICKSYRYLAEHDFDMKSRNVVAVWAFFAFAVMRLIDQWMEHVYKSFKRLRVLEVEQLPLAGRKSLRNIKNLIHLRYLCLSDVQLLRLPSSLGKLTCLQTLDLRGLDSSVPVKLPDIFWRMEQLRHLYLPEACSPECMLRLGNLKDLQTLVNFPCQNCNLDDFPKLTNLTELCMRGAETFTGLDQPMRCMLRLFNCDCGCGQCLRSSHIGLEEDPMPKLGKLPKLKMLTLEEDAFAGKKMEFTSTAFPQLQFLVLNGLSELEQLIVAQEAMPNLSRFSTSGCGKLEQLPPRLSSLQTY